MFHDLHEVLINLDGKMYLSICILLYSCTFIRNISVSEKSVDTRHQVLVPSADLFCLQRGHWTIFYWYWIKSQTFLENSQMNILNISIQMNSENFNSRVTVWHENFIRHPIQLKLILDYTVLKNVYSF